MSSKFSFMLKACFIGAILSLGNVLNSSAQTNNPGVLGKLNIASPNVAALGKYVDFPINKHTGVPAISIPVYTVLEGSLQLPISMSYHAGGIKLNELSSWVGIGWSLNAGGLITRTVRGTPDECGVAEFGKNLKGSLGHNGYNSYAFDEHDKSPLPTKDIFAANDFNTGVKDGEPDLFFFNFNGHTGKFYFNDDGQPILLPEADYKIEYFYNHNEGGSIKKFIITTQDGIKYHFGRTDDTNDTDPVEITHNYYYDGAGNLSQGTNLTINSWYLNRVVSADDKFSISLKYTNEDYSYRSLNSVTKTNESYQANSAANWKYYGHWINGVRLTSISSTSITVNFEAGKAREDLSEWQVAGNFSADMVNTQAKVLAAIQVTNNLNFCKKFKFSYDYFISPITELPWGITNYTTDQKRLKLDQIKEESCDGSLIIPAHKFEYFNETIPRILSFAQDHWGFINGKTSNLDLIPSFIKLQAGGSIVEYPGADRDSEWPAMRAGTLKKIIYPTGGFTEFEFEPNSTWISYPAFNKVSRFNFSMGYDGNTNSVIKSFDFSKNPYKITLKNTKLGGSASVYMNCPSWSMAALANQSTIESKYFTSGPCNITLSKYGAVSGNGADLFLEEFVPYQVSKNQTVGGLRIKKITFSNGNGTNDLVTNYDYNESSGRSSGHLYSKPTYVQIVKNDVLRDAGLYACCTTSPFYCSPMGFDYCPQGGHRYFVSGNSIRIMETTQGNHIGYNEVKVSSGSNGYSLFRYYGSNIWDQNTEDVAIRLIDVDQPQSNAFPNFPEIPKPVDFKRGELKYESFFNGKDQLLKETIFYYEYTENKFKTPALKIGSGTYLTGLISFYDLFTAKKTKFTIQERIFQSGGGYIETVTDNFYNSPYHNQVTKSIKKNSSDEQLEKQYKYSIDFKPFNCTLIDNGLDTYITDCATCQVQFNKNKILTTHNTAFWKYWDYQAILKCKSIARIKYITTSKNYSNLSLLDSYADCLSKAKINANEDLKPIYYLNDRYIIVPIETTEWRRGKLIKANLNSYLINPSGFPNPFKIKTIELGSNISADFTSSFIENNRLNIDRRYTDEATFKYDNGNIVEVVGKNKIATSYVWSYNNTLPIIKAIGVNYSVLQSTYNVIGSNVDQLRNSPLLCKAFITNYTYTPGVGINSETDANGKTIYYEYDKLQRLSVIRDQDKNILKTYNYNYASQ